MTILTQKTVVLKTVTASSVKLLTPADRIGQGTVVLVSKPANVLSVYPTSERMLGLRPRLAEMAMPAAAPPAERVGFSHVPGASARRHESWPSALPLGGWRSAARLCASETDFPGCIRSSARFDGDCQSPDRRDDRMNPNVRRIRNANRPTREVVIASTAQK